MLALTAAACSSPEDAGAPPAALDEQRALAEAEAMIPASELPSGTAAEATPSATADTAAAQSAITPVATKGPRDDQ